MFTHALRCIESDYPQLLHNAQLLGVMTIENGQIIMTGNGVWDFIGYKRIGEPPIEGQTDTRPYSTDGQGNKYVHINARTPIDVDAVARALAVQYPEIQEGLSEFNKFFITDPETGKWSWPTEPMRNFL